MHCYPKKGKVGTFTVSLIDQFTIVHHYETTPSARHDLPSERKAIAPPLAGKRQLMKAKQKLLQECKPTGASEAQILLWHSHCGALAIRC